MSDGIVRFTECALYECYNLRQQDSKYCIFHQPIRLKTGETE
jgi:hypothetical protein